MKTTTFEAHKYLTDEETIEEFLTAAHEDGDLELIAHAEEEVAKARAANAAKGGAA